MIQTKTEDCLPDYHKNFNWYLRVGLAAVKVPSCWLARRSLIRVDKICKHFRILCYTRHKLQGGAEPTDTFRIGILRRRDSLSWLAARGRVEERTPFHMVRNSMAVVREMFGTVISRFGEIAWPARSPNLTVPDFFLRGFV